MNITIPLSIFTGLFLGSFVIPSTAFGQDGKVTAKILAPSMKGLEFRNAATHSQLAANQKGAQQVNPMENLKARPLEEDPSKGNKQSNFINHSEVLCLNGSATFVPKRAILNTPDRFVKYLKMEKGAKVLNFASFYAINRGWIMTYEVSIEQAFGKKPFDEKKMKWLKGCGRVVIATFKNGPITVLPYVEESKEDTKKDPKL